MEEAKSNSHSQEWLCHQNKLLLTRRSFLSLVGTAVTANTFAGRGSQSSSPEVPADLDHILLGIDDLDRGIAFVEERTGVRAQFGGVHPGRGTRNALLRLGTRRYLEIIAPDPKQNSLAAYPELREMREPRLLTWAVHTDDIEAAAKRVAAAGLAAEGPENGSRARPDGNALHWKALRMKDDRGGLLPFFIEWGRDSAHPSQDAPSGCRIAEFSIVSKDPDVLRATFAHLGINVRTEGGAKAELRAKLASAKGVLELTS